MLVEARGDKSACRVECKHNHDDTRAKKNHLQLVHATQKDL